MTVMAVIDRAIRSISVATPVGPVSTTRAPISRPQRHRRYIYARPPIAATRVAGVMAAHGHFVPRASRPSAYLRQGRLPLRIQQLQRDIQIRRVWFQFAEVDPACDLDERLVRGSRNSALAALFDDQA